MPASAAHVQRARENEAFFAGLALTEAIHRSWAVVVLFYAALHWMDAYLGTRNVHPGDHTVRGRLIAAEPSLRAVYRHYRELETRSRDGRYELLPFTEAHVQSLHLGHLIPIRDHIQRLLAPRPAVDA